MTQEAWTKFQHEMLLLIGMKPIKVFRKLVDNDDSIALFERETPPNAPSINLSKGYKLLLNIKKPLLKSLDKINEVELTLMKEQEYIEVPIEDFDGTGIIKEA